MTNVCTAPASVDVRLIPLAQIQTDPTCQARAKIRLAVVRQYADAMKQQLAEGGLVFPPIVLFTHGSDYWLADGCHRVLAAVQAGLTEILAEVRPGSQRDALLHSISANNSHGLPRSNADKCRAVTLLLKDPEWSQWNDREIARLCGVSDRMVNKYRERPSANGSQMRRRKVRRGGRIYDMTPRAGNAPAEKQPAEATPEPSMAVRDPLGLPVPLERSDIFMGLPDFHEAESLFVRLGNLVDRIAQSPGGAAYRQDLIGTMQNGQPLFASPGLRAALGQLRAAEPYCCYCPTCQVSHLGRANPLCKKCQGRGWTTRAAYESCPESDREGILHLRSLSTN